MTHHIPLIQWLYCMCEKKHIGFSIFYCMFLLCSVLPNKIWQYIVFQISISVFASSTTWFFFLSKFSLEIIFTWIIGFPFGFSFEIIFTYKIFIEKWWMTSLLKAYSDHFQLISFYTASFKNLKIRIMIFLKIYLLIVMISPSSLSSSLLFSHLCPMLSKTVVQ